MTAATANQSLSSSGNFRSTSQVLRRDVQPSEQSVWRHGVSNDWQALKWAPLPLRRNPDIVLCAARNDWRSFQFAAPEIRADRAVVLEVLRCGGEALQWASNDLRGDFEVALEAVRNRGQALQYIYGAELRANDQLVYEAVTNDWRALAHAPEKSCADRAVVMQAVKQNGLAIAHVSDELRADREIVAEAVQQSKGKALRFASEALQADPDLCLAAAEHGCGVSAPADPAKPRAVFLPARDFLQTGHTRLEDTEVLEA